MRAEITLAKAVPPLPPALLTPCEPAAAISPGIIVFGRDERGRPHASRFAPEVVAETENAARLMGMHVALADTDALRKLAASLPAGRLFPSGKGLVPFVKADTFQRLLSATGTPDKPMPVKAAGKVAEAPPSARAGSGGIGGSDGGDGAAGKRPAAFDQIGIGSVVLACQGPMEGWWEAVVTYTKADDRFVLQWRDFPSDGEITRARKDLGLLPPDSREGLG